MQFVYGLCLFDVAIAFGFTLLVRSSVLRALFIAMVGVGLTVVHFFWPFARNGYWEGAYAFAPDLLPPQIAWTLMATAIGVTFAAWLQYRKSERSSGEHGGSDT
jgi:hypothetical protein